MQLNRGAGVLEKTGYNLEEETSLLLALLLKLTSKNGMELKCFGGVQ